MSKNSISNQQSTINNFSFTLIELLVVIGIIGVLVGLLTTSLSNIQMKSRDAKRKSDLRSIASALELYRQDQSPIEYPTDNSFLADKDACWSSGAGCSGNIYMRRVPADPDSTDDVTISYSYSVDNDALTYTLCACLENADDPEGVTGNCTDNVCDSLKYEVNEP